MIPRTQHLLFLDECGSHDMRTVDPTFPVFVLVALSTNVAATAFHLHSPGALRMVEVSLIGGFIATGFALLIAY